MLQGLNTAMHIYMHMMKPPYIDFISIQNPDYRISVTGKLGKPRIHSSCHSNATVRTLLGLAS